MADGRLLYYQLPIPFYYLTRIYDQFPNVGKRRMEVIEGPWGGASKVNAVLVVLAPMAGTLKDTLFFGPMHGASQVLANHGYGLKGIALPDDKYPPGL